MERLRAVTARLSGSSRDCDFGYTSFARSTAVASRYFLRSHEEAALFNCTVAMMDRDRDGPMPTG
jgi:hypothetical protein